MSSATKKTKKKKEAKKEVRKEITPQLVTCDLADNTYSGIIREDHLGAQFLESAAASYSWASGTKYEGPFVASQIEGRGKFFWKDGSTYEGELHNGKRHGEGTFVATDGGTRYEGQWAAGKRDGQGKLSYNAEGTSFYEGGWQAGQKHGFGKQLWPSGNSYEGEWKLGKMNGFGTMIWRNGSSSEKYTGEWVDNCPHGEGAHTWLSADPAPELTNNTTDSWNQRPSSPVQGNDKTVQMHKEQNLLMRQQLHQQQQHQQQQLNNRYSGQWHWGKRQGKGTFYYANGAYYHGEWEAHMKSGHGRHTFEDGRVYDGDFEMDAMVDTSKPDPLKKQPCPVGLEENPIFRCTDIADLEKILLPSDHVGYPMSSGTGYTDPLKIVRGIYNLLLRHLGEFREAYARYRVMSPALGEDPFVMTTCQFWHLARDSGLLTPACPIARFDRAVFSGRRHQREVAPEDEEDLQPLSPRGQNDFSSLRLNPQRPVSRGLQLVQEDAMSQANSEESGSFQSSQPSPTNEGRSRAETGDEAIDGPCLNLGTDLEGSSLGKKFMRSYIEKGPKVANIHAPARPLMFRQFIEGFVRLAVARYPNERGLESQVHRLFKDQVLPRLHTFSSMSRTGSMGGTHLSNSSDPYGEKGRNPIFSFLTEPQIQDVIKELEPLLWQIFRCIACPETMDDEVAVPGGGIMAGAGGIGANPCNTGTVDLSDASVPPPPTITAAIAANGVNSGTGNGGQKEKKSRKKQERVSSIAESNDDRKGSKQNEITALIKPNSSAIPHGIFASTRRNLEVMARLNLCIRVKDVLRLLDSIGLLKGEPPDTSLPLAQVLTTDNNFCSYAGCTGIFGLVPEYVEDKGDDGDVSEDDDGSGGSPAPEEDIPEDKKLNLGAGLSNIGNNFASQLSGGIAQARLPGMNFMPTGSLLSVSTSDKDSKAKKRLTTDKGIRGKEKESAKDAAAVVAGELSAMDLAVNAVDVLTIICQSYSPASLETLRWEIIGTDVDEWEEAKPPIVDERITILEFLETELVFAEFLRTLFLIADLTTKRDIKWARGVTIAYRVEGFLRHIVAGHLQHGTCYVPKEEVPPVDTKGKKDKKPIMELDEEDEDDEPEQKKSADGDDAAEDTGEPAAPPAEVVEEVPSEEAKPPSPRPELPLKPQYWRGFDDSCDARFECAAASRRWPSGYEQEVEEWEF
eukprot:TRINITY_DN14002_c0_g1_i1.p1 TRINITY_DN14002_c0_g1~~TRINITY_DN14002_c0_g1_i1.p1  ORF type:complete len:1185 (+),score=271.31 TRINITY_DN14002_c0_g1_i1:52-3606(+)